MKTKQVSLVINFILDNSGSMQSIKERTISGFNEYLQTLQRESKRKKNKVLFSLTKFNARGIEKPYVAVDINEIKPLNDRTYMPDDGTPLYDACVETIEAVEKEVRKMDTDPAVLVAIMTDGEENMSRKHDAKCLSDLIGKLQKKGNWTFVFLGANQDAWAQANILGISAGNTMSWQSTDAGTPVAFRNMAVNTSNYVAYMAAGGGGGGSKGLNTSEFFASTTDDTVKGGEDKTNAS